MINYYYNNLLAGHFEIKKTWELVIQKYYWPTFCHVVKAYSKGCNVILTLKAGRNMNGDWQQENTCYSQAKIQDSLGGKFEYCAGIWYEKRYDVTRFGFSTTERYGYKTGLI